MAQSFARFGTEVTIFEAGDHVLSREDEDAARVVQKAMEKDGIRLCTKSMVASISHTDTDKTVTYSSPEGVRSVTVDEILVGVGRQPNVDGLGLEAAGVEYDTRNGVVVNDFLQTSNARIYAAGDICSRFKFTHTADAMARIAIGNALFKGRARVSALTVPWSTYTDPEIAHVGLYEKEAKEQGHDVTTFTQPFEDVDRAILEGEDEGFVKVHVKSGTDQILGATMVGRHAGDMINEITLAMTNGLGMSAIAKTIHPYPTTAEAIKRTGDAYNRTRLTPFVANLMEKWLRLIR